ncbi:MAG: 3-methylornithine--L-lysine ligase PylC [Desulfovermiculus sp.]
MNIAILGGKLQGLEACYLAKKAGWSTLLIDTSIDVPAYHLCDHFLHIDIRNWQDFIDDLRHIDLLLPAVENMHAIGPFQSLGEHLGIPCIFDSQAYHISSSKKRSYDLLQATGIRVPQKWPQCGLPIIIKPDGQSGSKHVQIHNHLSQELINRMGGPEWVAEEYISGQLYSLEVIGVPGNYETFLVTTLVIDSIYDCKRVIAPCNLDRKAHALFEKDAMRIAEAVKLHGIMDVEAIYNQEKFVTIEIDARLPSQTPTSVYWSSGCNILEHYADYIFHTQQERSEKKVNNYVVYEHIEVKDKSLSFRGENCIAGSRDLKLVNDFYGAEEAITNVHMSPLHWVATLVFVGLSWDEVVAQRTRFYRTIVKEFSLDHTWDEMWECKDPLYSQ